MKKIVLFIMMFLCSIMPIHANSLASITIELQDSIDDLSKENVDFKLVQVAKLKDGYFVLNDAFQDLDVDFNVEFHAVDLCGYENMRPMLVSVPQWQEDELVYSVVVYPKHSPFEKLILKKVDQDTKQEILDEIEFTSYKDKDCKEKIASYKGSGTISILMRNQEMYLKETKAPKGYDESNRVLCVKVVDGSLYVDSKKLDSNVFEFENRKIHVPTGIEYHGNIYVTLGLVALVILLHLINKKLRK